MIDDWWRRWILDAPLERQNGKHSLRRYRLPAQQFDREEAVSTSQ
jgi:hypothetical protein